VVTTKAIEITLVQVRNRWCGTLVVTTKAIGEVGHRDGKIAMALMSGKVEKERDFEGPRTRLWLFIVLVAHRKLMQIV